MAPTLFSELLEEFQDFLKPLPDKSEENPEHVLRALWLLASGRPVAVTRVGPIPLPDLEPGQVDTLRALIGRKLEGVPLAHLTGRQEFLGLELLAGPEALIPRQETEILGRAARDKLREKALEREAPIAVDVCTGSGNLALALAASVKTSRVFGSDLSEAAVGLARKNATFTGLSGAVEFRSGDLLAPFDGPEFLGQCDLVTCNPPYIASAKVSRMPAEISSHEPSMAFDGGAMGVSVLMRLVKEAPRFLNSKGVLCFEVGLGQGPSMEKYLRRLPWVERVETFADPSGAIRAMAATLGQTRVPGEPGPTPPI
jgi:release factor glutamine methyltransferase